MEINPNLKRQCPQCNKELLYSSSRSLRSALQANSSCYACSNSWNKVYKTPEERFWPKVNKTDDCWIWTGCKDDHGYGRMHKQYAHRYSWELHYGKIESNLSVCHKCDNPPCVRPDHLFLGTAKDNAIDMVNKGRCNSGISKLTNDQILFIKEYDDYHGVGRFLASMFDVSPATITKYRN